MRDRLGARGALAVAAAAVLVTGLLAALTWDGGDRESIANDSATSTVAPSTTAAPTTTTSIPFVEVSDDRPTAFVWSPGGIDEDLVAQAAAAGEIDEDATSLIHGDRVMFVATADSSGTEVDRATGDLAYPLDLFSVDTDTLRPFVPVGMQRRALHELGDNEAIIGSSSSRLRRIKEGGTIEFRDGAVLTVAAVVPDEDVAGAEAVVAKATGERIGATTPRFVLVKFDDDLAPVQQAFRAAHPADRPIRIKDASETRFARSGDGVLTQVEIKLTFGEFGFVEGDGVREFAERDPAWVEANIGSSTLPVLGRIECHRGLLGSLRSALTDVDALQRSLQADYLASLPPPTTTTTTSTSTTTTAPPVGPDGSTSTTTSTVPPPTSTTTTTEPPPPEADPDYPVLLESDASLGCFNPRQVGQGGPENGVSRHAWGAAIDIRPPRGAARHDQRVVEIFARWGFINGQDWLDTDAPHFEWNVSPDAPKS